MNAKGFFEEIWKYFKPEDKEEDGYTVCVFKKDEPKFLEELGDDYEAMEFTWYQVVKKEKEGGVS